jgi:hypothetical protein
MTEAAAARAVDAWSMASWSDSSSPPNAAAAATKARAAIERARRLLKQLFTERSGDDKPPRSDNDADSD